MKRLKNFPVLIVLLVSGARLFAAETFPLIKGVESQPLLAQVGRLQGALQFIGQPLPENVRAQLASASQKSSASEVELAVQQALDPLCVGEVILQTNGAVTFTPV